MAVTAVALIAIQVLTDQWSSFYPNAARRVARPRQWLSRHRTDPGNGSSSPVSWEIGASSATAPGGATGADDDPSQETNQLTADEILNLDQNDIDMVRSISRMDDRDVLDIMVPRLDMDAIEITSSLDEVVKAFVSTRHTRLPVYRNTMDDVVGVVHISDVLPIFASGETAITLDGLMRDPEFVAENMSVDALLHLMRAKSLQMAVVVDEYGGVEGLVTLEDVLEEIVGEIEDEFTDEDPEEAARAEDGSWILNASVPLEEINRIVGVQLNGHDVNTIGGYVYTELGRMPASGDIIAKDGLYIEVVQVRGRRIQQVRLFRSETSEESGR